MKQMIDFETKGRHFVKQRTDSSNTTCEIADVHEEYSEYLDTHMDHNDVSCISTPNNQSELTKNFALVTIKQTIERKNRQYADEHTDSHADGIEHTDYEA